MQVQHHINTESIGEWCRCTSAHISGGRLICALDPKRRYLLMDAYKYAPHLRFLNIKTGDDLTSFVRTYGPLHLLTDQPVGLYWSFQSWLKAWVRLVHSFKQSKGTPDRLREALHRFLVADMHEWEVSGLAESGKSFLSTFLGARYSLPSDPGQWIPNASLDLIGEAAEVCLNNSGSIGVSLRAMWGGGRREINPWFNLRSLEEALIWMVWQDEFRKRPVGVCAECRTYFVPETAHQRKYCKYECAHRATAREWRRRDLRRKRGKKARREKRA